MKLHVLDARDTTQKHRVVFSFGPSRTVQQIWLSGNHGRAGYSVKAVINGVQQKEQILHPGDTEYHAYLEIGDHIMIFVLPINREGVYGQGRSFECRFNGKLLPEPPGVIVMKSVMPLVAEPRSEITPSQVAEADRVVGGSDSIIRFSVSDAGTPNVPQEPPPSQVAEGEPVEQQAAQVQ
jgi:hypothetical protein